MNTQASTVGTPAAAREFSPISAGQRLYWTVRRELWENRSIFFAPAAVAALTFVGFLVHVIYLPSKMRAAAALGPMEQHKLLVEPAFVTAGAMMLTTLAVGIFYCLDALYGERRDRSILFWKSLPVSDVETVLSKMITPVVVLPLVAFGFAIVTQWIMLLISSAVLLASGQSVGALWTHAALFQQWWTLLYHLMTVHGLWYAPIYAWLLLVSAWSRRAPFLWAALPPLAIVAIERVAFSTSHFATFLFSRLTGPADDAYMSSTMSLDPLMRFMPDQFVRSVGLWVGLLIAAIFLAGAVWLRRRGEPV